MKAIPRIAALLLLSLVAVAPLRSAPASSPAPMEYKVIADFKQPFNDALQLHFTKGWVPVGGISVTTWNSDFYFAQLIARPAKSGQ